MTTTPLAAGTKPHSTILKGIWLWPARLAWLFILAANLVLLYYLLPRDPFTMFLQDRFTSSWPALRGLLSLREYGWYVMALYYLLLLAFLGIGIFIAWRRSSDWMALFTSAVLISLGTQASKLSVQDTRYSVLTGYEWLRTLDQLAMFLSLLGLLALIYLFPDGRMIPRRLGWAVALVSILALAAIFIPSDGDLAWNLISICVFLLLAAGIFSQAYRYRRVSTPQQRQQVKWVIFGLLAYPLYLSATGLFSFLWLDYRLPIQSTLAFVHLHLTLLALLLIPLTLGISILRYRLWDIDLLVRRTLVYGALTFTLALIFFGSVTAMQLLFTTVSGQRSAVATVISTLLIAALFSPLRRRIQNDIDRRFFRQKYNAEQIVEAFGGRLREQVDLDEMSAHLLSVVEQALQPDHASLWIIPLSQHPRTDKEA